MATINGVIQAHEAALLAYAVRVTGDRYLAEDVVQETWIRVWRNLDKVDTGRSLRPWLFRIAHNVAVDLHRRRFARPVEVKLPEAELAEAPVQEPPCDEVETRIEVDAALEALTDVHRDTVVAVYYADRTAASAACALGVPVGTVKSRVHNALRILRDVLDPPQLGVAA